MLRWTEKERKHRCGFVSRKGSVGGVRSKYQDLSRVDKILYKWPGSQRTTSGTRTITHRTFCTPPRS